MSVFKAIMANFLAFLLAFFVTLVPYAGISLPVLKDSDDGCNLTVELISDTHLEEKELFRNLFLKAGLKNMGRAKCDVGAIVVCGDITTYADEPTLAKYYDIIGEYTETPVITVSGNHDIGHAGDRNVTDISREEALQNFIDYRNAYLGTDYDVNYYSTEVNGYKFIVLGDEVIDGGHWDAISMTDEQIAFLDAELEEGTADGKPVFVCCHWPIGGANSEPMVWPESGIQTDEYDLRPILEKYENVFWISGHMHSGVKATVMNDLYSLNSCEKVNGVTYITLPSFGLVNSFGIPWSGTGAQLEVYDGKVVFRPVNYLTGKWYVNSACTIELD